MRKLLRASSLCAALLLAVGGCTDEGLSAPLGLSAKAGNGQVTLTWTPDYDSTVQTYNLTWGLDQKSVLQRATLPATPTKYIAKGLTNGTKYYFAMTAVSTAGKTSPQTPFVTSTPNGAIVNPPELANSVPADKSGAVSITTPFQLDFSEAMDTNSINVNSVPPLKFYGANWTSGDTVVSFVAQGSLQPGTPYTLTVTGNSASGVALDPGTTFSFTTVAPPQFAGAFYYPDLNATARPVANLVNASGVETSAAIFIHFSTPMNDAYVNSIATGDLNNFPATITPSINFLQEWPESTIMKITRRDQAPDPSASIPNPAPLDLNQHYTISIGSDALSEGNIPFTTPVSFAFTVTGTADTTPPAVAANGLSPASGAQAGLSGLIQVQFTEPMNENTVASAVTVTSPAGIALDGLHWDPTSSLFTFSHSTPFPAGSVTVQISTAASDVSGNHLATTQTVTFTAASN